jgi:hypothetical protein
VDAVPHAGARGQVPRALRRLFENGDGRAQSGADALSFAFADTKLADLDKAFWNWVYDEHQRLLPGVAIDREDLVGLFDPLPKPTDELVARAKQSLTPETVEPPFEPATLAIGENDVESRHGLALMCARSGDFETAAHDARNAGGVETGRARGRAHRGATSSA